VNFCDKTTWYNNSTRTVETLSSSDQTTYVAPTASVRVNLNHGLISNEDLIGDTYNPVVLVNGEVQTQIISGTAGGGFKYDYNSGSVTFTSSLQPSDVVECSSSVVVGASWTLKPASEEKIRIEDVEIQFDKAVGVTDTVRFQAYGKVNDFAPQYTPVPYPSGTLIPIGNPSVFKTIYDYINEATKSYPDIPQMGGDPENNWRAMRTPLHVFRWEYKASLDLYSSKGMEIRLSLDNETPFSGTYAVTTFYGLSYPDENA